MFRSVSPRFEILLDCPEQAVVDSLERTLRAPGCESSGWVKWPYAELTVPDDQRRPWSPRLQVSMVALDEGGTRLRCVFRPEPGVWTGFVFGQSVLGILILSAGSVGVAQWTIGQRGTAMIGVAIGVVLSLLLYVGAMAGQSLGAEQMRTLRRVFDGALGKVEPTDSSDPGDAIDSDWDPTLDAELPGPCALE